MDENYIALAKLKDNPVPSLNDIEILLDNGLDVGYVISLDGKKPQWTGCTALHFLAEKEYSRYTNDIIKLLCSHGANHLLKNNKNYTPLRLAYQVHKESTNELSPNAKKLINAILTIHLELEDATNPCCDEGLSHFHIACLAGNRRSIKFFLDNDVSIDQTINQDSSIFPGCTGLHLAMLSENKNVVQLLLDRGADCMCLNARRLSPLHLIVEKQLQDSYSFINKKKLLESSSRMNDAMLDEILKSNVYQKNLSDCHGLSILHIYCTRSYDLDLKDWKTFLEAGLDLNHRVNLDSPICPGYSPLHFSMRCNLDTTIKLLKQGADPFVKDANDLTPIDLSLDKYKPIDVSRIFNAHKTLRLIRLQDKSKLSDVIAAFETSEKLTAYLRSVDVCMARIPFKSPLWPGMTLLHVAVKLMQGEDSRWKIKACLEAGVPLIVKDANEMTALHLAFHSNNVACVHEILRAHRAIFVNPLDKTGLSHFEIACLVGNKKIVKMFLSKNVDPNTPLKTDAKLLSYVEKKNRIVVKAGSTPLHIAAIVKSSEVAMELVQKKADIYRLDADGLTWIHKLMQGYYHSSFGQLMSLPEIQHKNIVAPDGLSHLHVACRHGSLSAVKAILPFVADVNAPIGMNFGKHKNAVRLDTPLHLAVREVYSNQPERVVDLLLRSGANLEAKNAEGLNPLHVALLSHRSYYSECKNVIKRIVETYDEEGMWPEPDTGLTKLHVACLINDTRMIRRALESGDSVSKRLKEDSSLWPEETPLSLLVKNEYFVDDSIDLLLRHVLRDLENEVEDTQPMHASSKRRKKSLLKKRDFTVNPEGLSVLHVCCLGDPSIVKGFLKLGLDFDVHKDYFASKDAGFYPLHFAVKYGTKEIIKLLLKYKINVDCYDSRGNTPMHLAALSHQDKIELFVKASELNVETKKNLYNKTVMDLFYENYQKEWRTISNKTKKIKFVVNLAEKYSSKIFKSFLAKIPNVNDVDANGRNVLHKICPYSWSTYSSFSVFCENIELLVNNGCELDLQDNDGQTPLHQAARTSNENKITALLRIGADVNVVDSNGKTALDYCFSRSNTTGLMIVGNETRRLLRKHVSKLLSAGFPIHDNNIPYSDFHDDDFSHDLDLMEDIFITKSLTLRYLLTEKMVMKFAVLSKNQQKAIADYLDSDNVKDNFAEWLPLFKMQLRKAYKREKLYEATFTGLQRLLDPRLPDHCLDSILILLNNADWENIISIKDQN